MLAAQELVVQQTYRYVCSTMGERGKRSFMPHMIFCNVKRGLDMSLIVSRIPVK